jgi:Fe2+ or Zn2+ uptake regulation protein
MMNKHMPISRLTPNRRAILEYLTRCEGLKSAADISAALPDMNLTTVYRALDVLVVEGAVKKFTLTDEEAMYEVQHEPHHHAICRKCGTVIHFTTDNAALHKEFAVPGFSVEDMEVTLYGNCTHHKK